VTNSPALFCFNQRHQVSVTRRISVARRTVLVCDRCGAEVGENKGAALRVTYTDARRGSKIADLCDDCAGEMPGRAAALRGRRPRGAAAD
jgi:hypothetical protein